MPSAAATSPRCRIVTKPSVPVTFCITRRLTALSLSAASPEGGLAPSFSRFTAASADPVADCSQMLLAPLRGHLADKGAATSTSAVPLVPSPFISSVGTAKASASVIIDVSKGSREHLPRASASCAPIASAAPAAASTKTTSASTMSATASSAAAGGAASANGPVTSVKSSSLRATPAPGAEAGSPAGEAQPPFPTFPLEMGFHTASSSE